MNRIDAMPARLRNLAPNLWVAEHPFKLPLRLGDIGARMTIIRLAEGGLFLHSPVPLDPAIRGELDALGPVRAIVAPSKAHHLFVNDYVKAYAAAKLHGAPGLPDKRRDLKFDSILADQPDADWQGQIEHHLFRGAPLLNEVVFFHPATQTVIFTDLVFNVTREDAANTRLFNWLTAAAGHFGPHRLVRRTIKDRPAVRASVERILEWDFERVIMSHGDVLERGGPENVRAAFFYL